MQLPLCSGVLKGVVWRNSLVNYRNIPCAHSCCTSGHKGKCLDQTHESNSAWHTVLYGWLLDESKSKQTNDSLTIARGSSSPFLPSSMHTNLTDVFMEYISLNVAEH